LATHQAIWPGHAWWNLVSGRAKPKPHIQIDENEVGLSSHGADLRELNRLHSLQKVGGTGWVYLEGGLEHVQSAVTSVLVAAVEKELELRDVERQVDFGNATISADHLTQPGPGAFHGVDLSTLNSSL